jgi:TonB family protein
MLKFLRLPLVFGIFLTLGCSTAAKTTPTPPPPQMPDWAENYLPRVRQTIEPEWKKHIRAEVKKRLRAGETQEALSAPENTVEVSIELDEDGKMQNIILLQEASDPFFTNAAMKTLQKTKYLPPPPTACFIDDHCKIRWNFEIMKEMKK